MVSVLEPSPFFGIRPSNLRQIFSRRKSPRFFESLVFLAINLTISSCTTISAIVADSTIWGIFSVSDPDLCGDQLITSVLLLLPPVQMDLEVEDAGRSCYYAILGVRRNASASEIRSSYIKQARVRAISPLIPD